MCTLCAYYLVDCSNGTMDNTAAVILLNRQVTGSAPSNAPLRLRSFQSIPYKKADAVSSKIEKVPRVIRGEKSSKDMASSRN